MGVLPHYQELELDLKKQGSRLINSYDEHIYVANFKYYNDLQNYTPKTWFDIQSIPENTPLIVKGLTNSKKMNWSKYMFAKNKQKALEIMFLLQEDSFIGSQDIIFRQYEQLKTFEFGLNNLPITNEFRFFYLDGKLIDYGFYWAIS